MGHYAYELGRYEHPTGLRWSMYSALSESIIQWLFLVPVRGGRWHITPQKAIYKRYISGIYCQLGDYKWYIQVVYKWYIPQLAVYTAYILPSGGLYATYHLLREPETTIELLIH